MPAEKLNLCDASCGVPPHTNRRIRREGEFADGHDLRPTSASRRTAVEETASVLTGTYAPGELESLREGWPA